MRKKIVAGNWKMNTTPEEGVNLAKEVVEKAEAGLPEGVSLIIAPPFVHIPSIRSILPENIGLSAQNCATENSGAYTGEVSAGMLAAAGANYVIIGHSERRSYYNETDEDLNKKIIIALENNLSPVFCCGEVLDEREEGIHKSVVEKQIKNGLKGISEDDFSKIIIAYEPVWAIGTGKTATPDQAQEMHLFIRRLLEQIYNAKIADETTILYGGSCKPSNAEELFLNPDVDGGLIGGASLNAEDFLAIARSFK